MRRLFVLFVLLVSAGAVRAQKTRLGQELPLPKHGVDYSLPVHVSAFRMHWNAGDCAYGVCTRDFFVNVVVANRHMEFTCSSGIPENFRDPEPVALGDTHGRFVSKTSASGLGDTYEILTPKGRVLPCWVSGFAE